MEDVAQKPDENKENMLGNNSEDGEVLVRRSQRERKSRVMYINGQPVLKQNNYGFEGEPSVFAEEIHRGKDENRSLDHVPSETTTWVKVQKQPPKAEQPKKEKAPKQISAAEQARKLHNDAMKLEIERSEGPRSLYLYQNIKVLQPFLHPTVVQSIGTKAALARTSMVCHTQVPAIEEQPAGITGELREYQMEGLQFLVQQYNTGVNAILADEMGLGKTLQTIAFLTYLKNHGVPGPHLVVVPLSVLPSWLTECARWSPALRVVRVHSNDTSERKRILHELLADPATFDIAVTTYDMVQSPGLRYAFTRMVWRYLVLDEGHRIKNELTLTSQALRHIRAHQSLLLTGTPLQNNLHELYALLNFLYPDTFSDAEPFDAAFDLAKQQVDTAKLEAAHYMLKVFCKRRMKEEVEQKLLPKVETVIHCPLSTCQTFWYRRLLLKDSSLLSQVEKEVAGEVKYDQGNQSWKKLSMLLMQLRKCCNHPYLFPGAEPDFDGDTGEDIVETCGKMGVLDRLLAKLKARGHRVVMFSQFNMMLDILEDFLNLRGYKYVRLDGSTNRVQRMIDMALFNKPDSDIFIYILNTRAGGLGLNLQSADTCILYDSDWNPQWDLQAMARVHRIGQTRLVHVYRLCTAGTVEERVLQRAERKLYLDQMVNRGGLTGEDQLEGLTKQELLSMLKFGADRIFANEQGKPLNEEDLEAIMDRSRATKPTAEVDPRNSKKNVAEFQAELPPISSFMLLGEDYQAARYTSLKGIASEFQQTKKRHRTSTTMRVGGYTVLKSNNYGYEGEPSVFASEASGWEQRCKKVVKQQRQQAGVDYQHSSVCQSCWDGGALVCCDQCACAYHPECLGTTMKALRNAKWWTCPHHVCAVCDRKTQAAGGLLFRCEMCPQSYCEDHLPAGHELVVHSKRFQELGQLHPKQACFIHCSEECKKYAQDYYNQSANDDVGLQDDNE